MCEVTVPDVVAFRKYVMQHSALAATLRRNAKIASGLIFGLTFTLSLLVLFIVFSGEVTSSWLLGIIAGGSLFGVLVGIFYNPVANDEAQVEVLHNTGELKSVLGQKMVEVAPETYTCRAIARFSVIIGKATIAIICGYSRQIAWLLFGNDLQFRSGHVPECQTERQ
jgi:hypothetical protein